MKILKFSLKIFVKKIFFFFMIYDNFLEKIEKNFFFRILIIFWKKNEKLKIFKNFRQKNFFFMIYDNLEKKNEKNFFIIIIYWINENFFRKKMKKIFFYNVDNFFEKK